MHMKPERVSKGGSYYFISRRSLKPVLTRDEYFESDDERYKDENYFLTKEAAADCASEISEAFGEKLERIAYNKEQNDKSFIKKIKSLPALFDLVKEPSKPGKKAEPKNDDAVFSMLSAIQAHDEKKDELDMAYKLIMASIENIIADANKE